MNFSQTGAVPFAQKQDVARRPFYLRPITGQWPVTGSNWFSPAHEEDDCDEEYFDDEARGHVEDVSEEEEPGHDDELAGEEE